MLPAATAAAAMSAPAPRPRRIAVPADPPDDACAGGVDAETGGVATGGGLVFACCVGGSWQFLWYWPRYMLRSSSIRCSASLILSMLCCRLAISLGAIENRSYANGPAVT